MTEQERKSKPGISWDLSSKFWKAFLVILATCLTFAGPTYVVYALLTIFKMDYIIAMITGFALFIAGIVLLWYLINKKVIS